MPLTKNSRKVHKYNAMGQYIARILCQHIMNMVSVNKFKGVKKVARGPKIISEFTCAELGDGRLENRLLEMVGEFNANPKAGTINGTMETWAATKAASRFFTNENFKAQELIKPHIKQTVRRMKHYPCVYAVSDTTFINYNGLEKTTGLGSIGRYRKGAGHSQGVIAHVTYAVAPDGLPLGILAIKVWARPREGYSSDDTSRENKESERWREQMLEVAKLYPKGTKMIYVADRESDIYELFKAAKENGIEVVVRSKFDRKTQGDAPHISIALSREEPKGNVEITVEGKDDRKPRTATLEIKSTEVKIADPKNAGRGSDNKEYVTINVVSVEEVNPPPGEEKIYWRLLTFFPVDTLEECMRVVAIYQQRWKIELLFKVAKSGCSIEQCRLQDFERIVRYLYIMFVIAWRLSWKIYVNRTNPKGHYSLVLSDFEYRTLWLMRNRKKIKIGECGRDPPDSNPWTVRDAIRAMAGLAGFNGRKRDGEPGMQKIWEGWIMLQNGTLVAEALL